MDIQTLYVLSVALAGVLFGAAVVWLAARGANQAAVETATVRAQSAAQVELSQLRERCNALERAGDRAQDALNELKLRYEKVRDDLDAARDEASRLAERAARVEGLEHRLATAADEQRAAAEELRRTSAEASEKAMLAQAGAERARELEGRLAEEQQARAIADAAVTRLTAQVSQLDAQLQGELKSSQEKLALLEEARNMLSEQFRNVANDLLEEKSKKFAEQNQANLGQLLDPLRLQINEFKGKVEEVYVQESKDRSAMAEQVRQLVHLNQALSEDARNLTNALKGNSKARGNWGELVLERVLESSGLRKGEEYITQDSQTREDGSRAQPDVVVMLPEQRKLVIDSKVSLTAYEEYTTADADEARVVAARRHLESVRRHVQGLSTKQYEKLYGNGLDFVLMFVPIEPAFMLAISGDDRLFMEAWERNVLLVSPSTLLFVVRTVAHLWRQEQQNRNAQDIASRGAELYDKLVDFVRDLEQVGSRLKQAKESYDDAHKRLATGKGNVIRQAEMLRELGVKAGKQLPRPLVEEARGELTALQELALIAAENTPSPASPAPPVAAAGPSTAG